MEGAELHAILGKPGPQCGFCEDMQLMQPLPRAGKGIRALTAAPSRRHTGVAWVGHQLRCQGVACGCTFQGPGQSPRHTVNRHVPATGAQAHEGIGPPVDTWVSEEGTGRQDSVRKG